MKLARLQEHWDLWARRDPMFVILGGKGEPGARWDPAEFFKTGEEEIAALLRSIRELGIGLDYGRALDFGCGLGRLTQALAGHFERVDGIDIAPSMVEQASRLNRHGENCRYHVNASERLELFADRSLDLVYSNIVLQHLPPRLAKGYILEFFRLLKPGGLAVFQVPARLSPGYVAERGTWRPLLARLAALVNRVPPSVPMYPIERGEVERLVRQTGMELAAALDDFSSGPDWVAYRYYVRRPSRH